MPSTVCARPNSFPGPRRRAEEIRELARLASASFGHAVGTCKMGVDKLAVVDPTLRVHGTSGFARGRRLRDATDHYGAGTNAPTHMIAGRAARLILGQNSGIAMTGRARTSR